MLETNLEQSLVHATATARNAPTLPVRSRVCRWPLSAPWGRCLTHLSLRRFGPLGRLSGCGSRRGRRLRCQLRRAGKEISDLVIAHLMEIVIVEADCSEHYWGFEADDLVGLF